MKIQYVLTPETAEENQVLQQSGFPWFPCPPRKAFGPDNVDFQLTGHYTCDETGLKIVQKLLHKE